MGRCAAFLMFRIPKSKCPAAQKLDPLLHIEDADAVAGALGGLFAQSRGISSTAAFFSSAKPLPVSRAQVSIWPSGVLWVEMVPPPRQPLFFRPWSRLFPTMGCRMK